MSTKNFDHNKSQRGKTSKLCGSCMIMTAIGFGMLGVHMRRVLQPATVLASSSGLGYDVPMNTESTDAPPRVAVPADGSPMRPPIATPWEEMKGELARSFGFN